MWFLADMGVSPTIVEWLRNEGHDAIHLRDQGLHRLKDPEIFRKASAEARILLTFDLDFSEIAALSAKNPAATIVFRLRNTRTEHVRIRLAATIEDLGQNLETSVVVTVEESRCRVRRLPIGTVRGD